MSSNLILNPSSVLQDAQTDAEVLASKEVKEALELLEANVPAT